MKKFVQPTKYLHLIANRDFVGMEKMCALMFVQAVTKSIAGLKSLSHTRNFPVNSALRADIVCANTLEHLLIDHTCISVFLMSVSSSNSASPPWEAASDQESGTGGWRVFHRFSTKN